MPLLLILWTAAMASAELPQIHRPEPIRVLVVTGGHDYDTSFYTLFEGDDDLQWDHANSNEEAFRRDIRDSYDVLVLYDMVSDLSAEGRVNLRAFVESGKGVVVLHHAILNYPEWPWWYESVVGGLYLAEARGDLPPSTYRHDELMVLSPALDHPVTDGIEPVEIEDETYEGVWISPDVTPLLTTENPTSDRVVAWVGPSKTSRVVYIQPGHGAPAHRHPTYRRLVRNAIVWTSGR